MRKTLCLVFLLFGFGAPRAVADGVPRFEDYKVPEAPPGSLAPADLDSHPKARRYATLLRRAASEGVNFAGRFTAVRIGCGTSCASLALIDRRTGRVFFPAELGALNWADWQEQDYGFAFAPRSRLVRACGAPGEVGVSACRFYEWKDESAHLVATIPRSGDKDHPARRPGLK